jgi:hypothetical protein
MAQKRNFWTTIPGFLTGTATVISAVLGLLAVFGWGGDSKTNSSPTPVVTESPSPGTDSGDRDSGGGGVEEGETRVRLSPQSVDFGRQNVGSPSPEQNVTVTNTGTQEVAITSVEITGADSALFQIASNDCGDMVQPEYDCKVALRFTPQAAGNFRATLVINHDAAEGPTDVTLQGTGSLLGL